MVQSDNHSKGESSQRGRLHLLVAFFLGGGGGILGKVIFKPIEDDLILL